MVVLQCVSYVKLAHLSTTGRIILTNRMCLAKCSLRVKLNWQGGKSVQKKRWPFFFFDGRCESLVTLSLSEPSSSAPSSASPSPISTSSEVPEALDRFELPRFSDASSLFARSGPCADGGSSGRGRWPRTPPKLCRVGVSGAESSAGWLISVGCWHEKRTLAVGVVGVFSSRCCERSGALSEVWTISLETSAIARSRSVGLERASTSKGKSADRLSRTTATRCHFFLQELSSSRPLWWCEKQRCCRCPRAGVEVQCRRLGNAASVAARLTGAY